MRNRWSWTAALVLFLAVISIPQVAEAASHSSGAVLSSEAALRATLVSGPAISASPGSLSFGSVTIGQTATRTLTVMNTGDQTVTLTNALISDSHLTSTLSSPRTILVGGSTTFSILYAPTVAHLDTGTLTLVSNSISGPLAVPLSGTGEPLAGPNLGAGRIVVAPTGESEGDQFGISVASAGNVNGDAYSDVIVGAWTNNNGGADAGRAYIYFGGTSPSDVPARILQGAASGDNFGTAVASAGDVNGDGFSDVIVGAYGNGAGGNDAGRAYVYYGGPGMDAVADLTLTGQAAGDRFGVSVSSAGDVNHDGYADVVVGAFLNDAGGTDAGRAYVYFGGPSADGIADCVFTGAAASDDFGWSVASAGDVNRDGFDDVLVGALQNDVAGTDAGRVYVYFGGIAPDNVPDWILTGEHAGDRFGVRVAPAGDVNGDGSPDIIVGADFNSAGGIQAGRAYVYYGGPGPDAVADLTLTGDLEYAGYGAAVSSAGDANGDGFDDLLVGAWLNSAGGAQAGRAYLYLGGPGADPIPDAIFTGQAPGDNLGDMVAPAGDVDGDGRDDVILGAYFNDAFAEDAGRAYVVSLTSTRPPVVASPTSISGAIGTAITFQVAATDPDGGAILSLIAAPLPSGATFAPNGTNTAGAFAWTPGALQAGAYTVTFTASNGVMGSSTTTITVVGGNHPPVVTAPAGVFGAEGTPISFDVQATDADGNSITLGVLNRPVGSLFVDNGNGTGVFNWTPGFVQSGSYVVSFTAKDNLGADAVPKAVPIVVDNVNRGPTSVPGGPYSGVVNVSITFDGTGSSDPDGDALTHHWSFGDGGTASGPTPLHQYTSGSTFAVTLTVADGSQSASASTTATVQDVFPASAFLEGAYKTTRLNSGKATTCVQIEPVEVSYLNTAVDIASIVMISAGTGSVDRISAIADKTTIGADRNRNNTDEITACFAKTDLRNLFSALSGGRHTVGVVIEGSLTTGGRFRTTLEMDVVASGGNGLAAWISPNPLNPSGVLTFRISKPGSVTITMFDPAGRLVRTVLSEPYLAAGYHDAPVDGRRNDGARLPSGVYFYRIETEEGVTVGRFVVLK